MIPVLWNSFPRLLEQNINGLLDGAVPTALKALQIYRALQNESLWRGSIQKFSKNLEDFFARPRAERRKSQFDIYLDRPMNHEVYSRFQLDFRTAVVSDQAIENVASWAYNLIRVSKKTTAAFVSLDVMIKTLRKVTSPAANEKTRDIEFGDFCAAWKKTVFSLFGDKHEREFNEIVAELEWLDAQLKKSEMQTLDSATEPTIYLTQTEIDWTLAVREAALENDDIPKFPLSRGPQKRVLRELERVVSLYALAQTSRLPEIVKNRDNIRATVLDRCDTLLGKKQKPTGSGNS